MYQNEAQGIPFELEDWPIAQARYPLALRNEWDGDAIGVENNPSMHRTHVFDLAWNISIDDVEHWRLIVSTARLREIGRVLHVIAMPIKNGPMLVPFRFTRAMLIFGGLSNRTVSLSPIHQALDPSGAVHLIFDAPQESLPAEGGRQC